MAGDEDLRPSGGPTGIYGPDGEPQFFSEPGMDRFVAVVMNMAAELWIQEERLRALEGEKASASAVDPDQAVKAFIDRIFAPLREPASAP